MIERRRFWLVPCVAWLVVAFPCRADEASAQNKDVATDLFDDGVRQMDEGGCDQSPVGDVATCEQARESFARAYALYPAGLGALRNLAFVEKNLGLVASAARNFRELARQAPLDPKPARRLWADFAREEVEALAPRIPHLTVSVEAVPDGFELELDGDPLPRAAWETELDVDPGRHVVSAKAPDFEPFTETVELAESGHETVVVQLGRVAQDVPDVAPKTAPQDLGPAPRRAPIGPWIVMGTGAATLGAGLVMGYVAIRKRKSACGDSRYCEPTELESGRSIAHAATYVTVAGAAVAAGGLVWYFLAPRGSGRKTGLRLTPVAAPGHAGLEASGRF